jgi:hypothetical protein
LSAFIAKRPPRSGCGERGEPEQFKTCLVGAKNFSPAWPQAPLLA